MYDKFLDQINSMLPRLASVKDLLRIGIYRNAQGAALARRKKKCPLWFRLPGQGIVYPRESVIEFLKNQIHKSNNISKMENAANSHSKVPPVDRKSK